ncbi:MAG TPA: SCP2 sterol-binding domain-containing protein [Candidatus Anoxymicrobiaceae bacterium]
MSYLYGTKEWEETFSQLMTDMMEAESEPYIMGTPSWISAYESLIQNDATYKQVAQAWEGTVVEHIMADPEVGLDEDMYVLMDLWHGECRSVRLVPKEIGEQGNYVLSAAYDRWKQVMTGQLDPVKGMMQGKIKLRGDLPTIVRYVKAATRLAELVGDVNTIFLDDMTPEEIEAFKPWVEFFRDEYGL